ncbi:MAG: DUF3306 domain-containing protein [Gammaproteobacteria bacterium]|nr:DUF3306 domain-containing protein [Gammaproteobacteria bacterium]
MSDTDRPAGQSATVEPFAARWSRLKREESQHTVAVPAAPSPAVDGPPPLTDADMPPIDSLDESSDFSGFMSPGVSDPLRRLALRRLFSGQQFNLRDGLDDYDDDFTSFAKLADIVTADMRHQLQRLAEREQPGSDRSGTEEKPAVEAAAESQPPTDEDNNGPEAERQPAREEKADVSNS